MKRLSKIKMNINQNKNVGFMKSILILFTFSIFLITGCNNYQIVQPSKEHPANPQAVTSSDVEQTDVLRVDDSNLPETPSEMKSEKMKHM